jgi:hypothetical protein
MLKNPIRPVGFRDNQVIGTLIKETDWQFEFRVPESHFIRYSSYAKRLREIKKKYPGIPFYGLKIVWKKSTPSPGFIQWTIRPYVQSMGCDGTTDGPIHLIAKTFVQRQGENYEALYKKAYPSGSNGWLRDLERNYTAETIIPQNIDPKLMLSDLYDINNRSLVEVLSEKFKIDY